MNSVLYDDHWRPIGLFAPPDHVVIDNYDQISPAMRDAIVAIEDKRFNSDPGVDIRGIARAFIADVTGSGTQGASTITEQFVKNALQAQNNRTIFEKLREAALAYHLTRKWSKRKILAEYLNSIYFGNGANGVESAARVYFGKVHGYDSQAAPGESRCGDSTQTLDMPKCAKVLTPWEAAMLAGMVANPSAFNPFEHPHAALGRRNLVLKNMLQQGYISRVQYDYGVAQPLPTINDLQQPAEPRRGALLHELAAPADPRRDGPAPGSHPPAAAERRVPRLLRRTEDPDDARSAAPAGGRPGDRLGPPVRAGAAHGFARVDRQQDGRGQGDGRRSRHQ